MVYSIAFGSGGSPSSGRNVTGATIIRTDGAFVWPTGNSNLAGSSIVTNEGIDLNGSRSGDILGYSASFNSGSGYGDIVMTSGGGTVYLTGYIGNGLTMYSNLPNSWDGGFQGTFYWSTVPTAPGSVSATRTGRDVYFQAAASGSDGGQSITSYQVQYRTSTDNATWGAWGNTQTLTAGVYNYTGLTPALYYQFRSYANNPNGSSAATVSASVFVPAGGKRWNGSAWVSASIGKRWNGTAWVDLTIAKRWSGSAWVDLS